MSSAEEKRGAHLRAQRGDPQTIAPGELRRDAADRLWYGFGPNAELLYPHPEGGGGASRAGGGPTGPTGPRGPTGPTGPAGSSGAITCDFPLQGYYVGELLAEPYAMLWYANYDETLTAIVAHCPLIGASPIVLQCWLRRGAEAPVLLGDLTITPPDTSGFLDALDAAVTPGSALFVHITDTGGAAGLHVAWRGGPADA